MYGVGTYKLKKINNRVNNEGGIWMVGVEVKSFRNQNLDIVVAIEFRSRDLETIFLFFSGRILFTSRLAFPDPIHDD